MLKPYLTSGDIRMIGATTEKEYYQHLAGNNPFVERFETVKLRNFTIPETIQIIEGIKARREDHYGVTIPTESVVRIVERCALNQNAASPRKEIKKLDKICVRAKRRFQHENGIISVKEANVIIPEDIEIGFSE